jgi:hypothetical protein
MCQQHDLSVREFKRIMVGTWILHVDLPKTSNLIRDCPFSAAPNTLKPGQLPLDFLFKPNLCTGKEAHR